MESSFHTNHRDFVEPQTDQDLREILRELGHSPDAISRILHRLSLYDRQTVRSSVFDSIEQGSFNLDAIIREALSDH